jgi:hypothetical protein
LTSPIFMAEACPAANSPPRMTFANNIVESRLRNRRVD